MKFTADQIKELYAGEARKHGLAGTSTIQDIRTRELEWNAICDYLSTPRRGRDCRILDVGCGNGWLAAKVANEFKWRVTAIDISAEMIELAKAQKTQAGNLSCRIDDARLFTSDEPYHYVYSVRCLQNLEDAEAQRMALHNIAAALVPGGEYLMIEGFTVGLINLNTARYECGLPDIEEPWHNNFLDQDSVVEYMQNLTCSLVMENCFLSGYYFGSRVLLPVITRNQNVKSSSILNDYFCHLPPHGDFCPMKMLVFRRAE